MLRQVGNPPADLASVPLRTDEDPAWRRPESLFRRFDGCYPHHHVLIKTTFLHVFIEHLIYSAAVAVIAGLCFSRFTGRDPSWIIIAVAFIPDLDFLVYHGGFHNIVAWIALSLVVAAAASTIRIPMEDAFICAAIGIWAHFFEDGLTGSPGYMIFWPVKLQRYGMDIFTKSRDLFGIANSEALLIGIILLTGAICLRTLIEGKGWWKIFLQGGICR